MNTTASTPGIGAIQAVGIPVTDQDRALHFYTDTLDFEVLLDVPLPQIGGRWITVAPRGTTAAMALIPADSTTPAGIDTRIRFHTDDAEATHAALSARAVEVGELLRWPGVPAMFTAQDPDGNSFVIVE